MAQTRTQTTAAVGTSHGVQVLADGSISTPIEGRITAIHADENRLWALVDGQHLYRSDGGAVVRVAGLDVAAGVCVGTHRGTVWVGGRGARLWRLDGATFRESDSFREAPTHEDWHTP